MQRALESAVAELVLGAPLVSDDPVAVEAWLSRHGVDPEDARAIRDGELRKLLVYRELVRGTLREALEASIPRAMARLGDAFERSFDRFLAERGPRTHYVRDVTTEFLAFCAPLWEGDASIPEYVLDLARHEALHIEIAALPRGSPPPSDAPLELDAVLDFDATSRLVEYRHAVHELPEDVEDRSLPERRRTRLFVYRSAEHEVRYLELTPLASTILERLMAGSCLKRALFEATAAENSPLDDAVLSGTARLLSDLAERGALLGVRAKDDRGDPEAVTLDGASMHQTALDPNRKAEP